MANRNHEKAQPKTSMTTRRVKVPLKELIAPTDLLADRVPNGLVADRFEDLTADELAKPVEFYVDGEGRTLSDADRARYAEILHRHDILP